jgi:probable rRNA maturation factor
VQIATRSKKVPAAQRLRRYAAAALPAAAEVTLRVCTETEARRLNRNFRGKDYATNVLSFSYEAGKLTRGDLVLCAAVVAREARAQGKPLEAHYAHLAVHGALHLAGYEHERAAEARIMEGREQEILARLGFPDPYAETSQ